MTRNVDRSSIGSWDVSMIYRATDKYDPGVIAAAITPRAPGNVPFLVDNIWEWLRPEEFPSRRFAAFASPRREQAAASAGCSLDQVYAVELTEEQAVCQITVGKRPEDARFHPDIDRFKRRVIRALPREWFALPSAERGIETVLFVPCASRGEVDFIMRETRLISPDQIREASTFWQDVRLIEATRNAATIHASGEIFFEGRYRLV